MSLRDSAIVVLALCAAPWLPTSTCTPAGACGHCIEDKVAATYDYALLTRVARIGHVVVFTEILGPVAGAGATLESYLAHGISSTTGIDAGSVRISMDPAAASFACSPAGQRPAALISAINARLAARGLRLALIRIERGPVPK